MAFLISVAWLEALVQLLTLYLQVLVLNYSLMEGVVVKGHPENNKHECRALILRVSNFAIINVIQLDRISTRTRSLKKELIL